LEIASSQSTLLAPVPAVLAQATTQKLKCVYHTRPDVLQIPIYKSRILGQALRDTVGLLLYYQIEQRIEQQGDDDTKALTLTKNKKNKSP
jgi:hypothetical protein